MTSHWIYCILQQQSSCCTLSRIEGNRLSYRGRQLGWGRGCVVRVAICIPGWSRVSWRPGIPGWARLGRRPGASTWGGLGGAPVVRCWDGLRWRPPLRLLGLLRLAGCQPGGLDGLHSAGPGCGHAGRPAGRRCGRLGREPAQAHIPFVSEPQSQIYLSMPPTPSRASAQATMGWRGHQIRYM